MEVYIKGLYNTLEMVKLINAFYPLEKLELVENAIDNGLTIEVNDKRVDVKYIVKGQILFAFGENFASNQMKDKRLLIKRVIFIVLSNMTDKKMPWGILTGIRPSKIVLDWYIKNISYMEIKKALKEKYLVSDEKIDLLLKVVKEEYNIIKNYTKEDYSLYIGIPFCPSRCLYCSFTACSIEKWSDYVNDYLDALEKEIDYIANKFNNKRLRTIYIGGGTPTSLSDKQLERLHNKIVNSFDLSNLDEWTVEAGRPDSITKSKLKTLKKFPVSRISINPQTMNQKTLNLIGRNHTPRQVIDSFKEARNIGFDNINMDLIIGLPGEAIEDVKHTLNRIKKLDPDNITVHTLALKRASRLIDKFSDYEYINEESLNEIQKTIKKFAKIQQYKPYYLYRQKYMVGNLENIGYTKDKKACIYNCLIMEEKQTIIALGAGASSKIVFLDNGCIKRIENVKNVSDYINRIDDMIKRKEDFFKNL
ncbi:MAG: coproporphyrinogen dehydrogenase HemZ [Eubacteriales bacterium]